MAAAMAFRMSALLTGFVSPPVDSRGQPSPAEGPELRQGCIFLTEPASVGPVSSSGRGCPFAIFEAAAVLAPQPMLACLEAQERASLCLRSLWSLWSFNERHTAARTFLGPMVRNAVVSTAAGAGPGAIAGFDTENSDQPLLGEPPSSSRDQKEQNKTGCAYSPSPVCSTHVPHAAPHGVCVGPLNYHSGSYPHTPLLGQWRGSASDAQASQEAKDSSSSQGQPERDPRSASGRHLGDQR
mmetsp:Transcript_55857/g.132069  ORF Transcript_55857/g.132069 Transcript_55857/m.132069 type:complete len:240 (+) Transcript_55857:438-1157(+)